MENSKNILVVEDEAKILEVIKAYLDKEGYVVTTSSYGKEGLEQIRGKEFDLIILDLMLPYISGEEICKIVRKNSRVPIIMLTAKVDEDDRINGFNIGADDYITKPFSPRELVVRVKSILRRCSEDVKPLFSKMSWNDDDLIVDLEKLVVKKKGETAHLTPNELKILMAMVKYPNKAFTREELIEIAFGIDYDGFERTIDSHIKNMRSKIECEKYKYIVTVRGVGYRFKGESD